jgi:hypothetical protein
LKERAFIDAVHRHLPPSVFRQGMTMASMTTGGTPDYYYDFQLDLWVEYKALSSNDALPALIPEKALPTSLQRAWLDRRFANGGNVLVAVGLKVKGRVHGFLLETPEQWATRSPREWYEPKIVPVASLASSLLARLSAPRPA